MNAPDTYPLGYWITAVDRLMKAEFATVFADEGITRRDWRLLNIVDGTASPRVSSRPLRGPKMHRLVELGWIERTAASPDADAGWTLTEAGRLAKTRLSTAVDEMRARVAGAVTPDEYAAMTGSLEKIAREFGWEPGKPLPRRHGHGRRFAPWHGRRPDAGCRRGHDFGHGREHGHGHHPHGHGRPAQTVEHHIHIHAR